MKRIKFGSVVLLTIVTISSSALAGNIGGMRTVASVSNTYYTSGNIGGVRSEPGVIADFSTTVAGNIGGLLNLILGSTLIP